jgi:hypothetical protein
MRYAVFCLFLGVLPVGAIAQTASQLNIAWDYLDSATKQPLPAPPGGFHILRCTPASGQTTCTPNTTLETPPPAGGNVIQQFWNDKTVVAGTTYCYGVQALDANHSTPSAMSNVVCKAASHAPLPAPTNVRFQ